MARSSNLLLNSAKEWDYKHNFQIRIFQDNFFTYAFNTLVCYHLPSSRVRPQTASACQLRLHINKGRIKRGRKDRNSQKHSAYESIRDHYTQKLADLIQTCLYVEVNYIEMLVWARVLLDKANTLGWEVRGRRSITTIVGNLVTLLRQIWREDTCNLLPFSFPRTWCSVSRQNVAFILWTRTIWQCQGSFQWGQAWRVNHIPEVKINSDDQSRESNLLNLASFECKDIQKWGWRCVSVRDYTSSETPWLQKLPRSLPSAVSENTALQTASCLSDSSWLVKVCS